MQSRARIVHKTASRIRLRIPERRKDIPYFLDLYEELRQISGVTDVVINPLTGSVLLYFPGRSDGTIVSSLRGIGLLPSEGEQESRQPVLERIERLFASDNSGATDVRTVLLVIMTGLAVHQALRGEILAPALSVLLYAYDLVAAHKKEKPLPEATPETPSIQS